MADSSPLVALVTIGHAGILPSLFGTVLVPPTVLAELFGQRRVLAVQQFAANPPTWLTVAAPRSVESIAGLHAGEQEAISLALEHRADLLLIGEREGRAAALARKLEIAGTVGLLERAATEGWLNLGDAFERLKRTDFWISHALLDERLRRFNAIKRA